MKVEIVSARRFPDGRVVASVKVGPLNFPSLWALPAGEEYRVSWPRTGQGYDILTIDEPEKSLIEAAIKAAAPAAKPVKGGHRG